MPGNQLRRLTREPLLSVDWQPRGGARQNGQSMAQEQTPDPADWPLGVLDGMTAELRSRVIAANRGSRTWVDGIRAALLACLRFFDEDAARARLMVVDTLGGEPPVRARRERLLGDLARCLEEQRPKQSEEGEEPSQAQAVIGAVAAVIHARLLEDPPGQLTPLGGILMSVIVMPYLGAGAARDELERNPQATAA